jgi:prophage DNA circulation protein
MSGALLSLFDELFDAEFRGVPFHMPDVREETGRRTLRFLFPGRDDTWHEDMGALDGAIRVSGLIIGDDYIRRARRMREAFRTPGPGRLTHPWLGDLDVVLAEPAEISFSQGELRLARFQATFEPWIERPPEKLDTLGLLLAALDALREGARRLLRMLLAPLRLVLGVVSAVVGFARSMVVLFRRVLAGVRGLAALPREIEASFRGLLGLGSVRADARFAGSVALAFAAPSTALREAARIPLAPAVAPFGGAPILSPTIPPASAAEALLAVQAELLLERTPLPALRLAAAALVLADAVAVAAPLPFASRGEAFAMRDRLDAALSALAAEAVAMAASDPEGAGGLWRELLATRAAVARDLTERGGRLPAVETLRLPGTAPTWLVAHHLAGDAPSQVAGQYLDLVARNSPRRPARLSGDVEVLRGAGMRGAS